MASGNSPSLNRGASEGLLHSWKEIAAYFDVTIRTVQNWEEERGLPVQRMPGPRGRVWARVEELEAWRNQLRVTGAELRVVPENEQDEEPRPGPAPFKARQVFGRYWIAAALVLLLGAASLAGLYRNRGTSTRMSDYRLSGDTLTALDKSGHPLWNYTFDKHVQTIEDMKTNFTGLSVAYPDIDGDGANELAFPVIESPSSVTDELFCFDAAGRIRWRYTPEFTVRNALGETYNGPWKIRAVSALPLPGGGSDVLVSVAHVSMFPSVLTRLDRSGKPVQSYYHSGHLNDIVTLDADHDGRHVIYAAGMANSWYSAAVVALDPDRMNGASQEPSTDKEHTLVGLPPAREKARVVIPPTPYSLVDSKGNTTLPLMVEDNQVIVSVVEVGYAKTGRIRPHPCNYFQVFNSRLQHISYRIADSMELAYREYYSLGLLPSPDPKPDVEKATRSIRTLVAWN